MKYVTLVEADGKTQQMPVPGHLRRPGKTLYVQVLAGNDGRLASPQSLRKGFLIRDLREVARFPVDAPEATVKAEFTYYRVRVIRG